MMSLGIAGSMKAKPWFPKVWFMTCWWVTSPCMVGHKLQPTLTSGQRQIGANLGALAEHGGLLQIAPEWPAKESGSCYGSFFQMQLLVFMGKKVVFCLKHCSSSEYNAKDFGSVRFRIGQLNALFPLICSLCLLWFAGRSRTTGSVGPVGVPELPIRSAFRKVRGKGLQEVNGNADLPQSISPPRPQCRCVTGEVCFHFISL